MFEWIVRLFGSVWKIVKPAVNQLATETGKVALDIAIETVEELERSPLKGEDKYEAAYKIIRMNFDDGKVEIGDSLINYAIETAVQRLKSMK